MPSALIWGASGGIGSALVRQLRQDGWTVFGAARSESGVPDVANSRYEFSAGDEFSFRQVAYDVAQEVSTLDLVVYAAGMMRAAPLDQMESADFQAVLEANLIGAQRAIKVSLPLLSEGGVVMVLGAHVDRITLPKFGAYAVAKAALEPMMGVLRKENRKQRFCMVRPGAVDTPFWANVPFSLPKNALSADSVAEAMLAHFHAGADGDLNL